jgi:branched-chain amino acid transport system substrate-binding protein
VKGLDEYRLKDKFRVLINFGATGPGTQLKEEGKAALGIYLVDVCYKGLNTPVTKEYLDRLKKKYGYHDNNHNAGYMGAEVIGRALEQIRGNIEDKEGFLEALRNLRFESINGPFEFDRQGQNALPNFYVIRNEMVGGEIDQVLVDVLPKMRDPWWIDRQGN